MRTNLTQAGVTFDSKITDGFISYRRSANEEVIVDNIEMTLAVYKLYV